MAKPNDLKRFFRYVFVVVTFVFAIIYLFACLTPFISPVQFVVIGFAGLAFPVLLLAIFLIALTWLLIHRKTGLLLLLLLLCGTHHIVHIFSWHSQQFRAEKQAGTVRIMGWNVQSFNTHDIARDLPNSVRHRLFSYIRQQQPDIVCIQDFLEYNNLRLPSNLHMLVDSLGYHYYFSSNDYVEYPPWGPAYSGIAIFSKFPLQHLQRFPFTGKKIPESIITADVTINGITRRLIVTHLQSMHLHYSYPPVNDPWKVPDEDSTLNFNGTIQNKLAFYLPYHAVQAVQVKKIIEESPWPVIFSADLNEVPSSYCYYKVKGSLQDAFLEKGTGLGRTYTAISPTLRIDYLMASKSIKIVQYLKDTVMLSDHYPQIMDVKW